MVKKNRLTKILDNISLYAIEFNTYIAKGKLKVTLRCNDGRRLSFTPSVEEVETIMRYMNDVWSYNITSYTAVRDGVLKVTHSDGRYD